MLDTDSQIDLVEFWRKTGKTAGRVRTVRRQSPVALAWKILVGEMKFVQTYLLNIGP